MVPIAPHKAVPVGSDILVKAPRARKGIGLGTIDTVSDTRWDILQLMSWDYMDRFPKQMEDSIEIWGNKGEPKVMDRVMEIYKQVYNEIFSQMDATAPAP